MGNFTADQAAPARSWKAVTPHDTNNLPAGCRGIYVGGLGNVALVGDDDVAVVFTAVPVGTFMPCGPKRVNNTSTTATLLIALY
jgi:hypothetical protein